MATGTTASTGRVCPSCGEVPGGGIHCVACGANLMWCAQLPSREEWERSPAVLAQAATSSETPESLRYNARDLESKRIDPGDFKSGRLLLMLLLNERLDAGEDLEALARVRGDLLRYWMIITSRRVLIIWDASVSAEELEVQDHPREKVTDPRVRRYIFRSRLQLDVDGERKRFTVRGRKSAGKLRDVMTGAGQS